MYILKLKIKLYIFCFITLTTRNAKGQINSFNISGVPNLFIPMQDARSVLTCNTRSQQQRSILKTANPLPSNCTYTILPYKQNVCQVRLDFDILHMQQPTYEPNMQQLQCNDYMAIVVKRQAQQQTNEPLRLCGENSGQHYYVPLHRGEELQVTFILTKRWPQTTWYLQLNQLECPATETGRTTRTVPFLMKPFVENFHSNAMPNLQLNTYQHLLAPSGCHQYYIQRQGIIKTFNFNFQQRTLYMPNLRYVICISGHHDTSHIKYRINNFEMSQQNSDALGFDYDCHSLVETFSRKEDFLMIPQSNLNNALLRPTYFCGQSLRKNMEIIARAPFNLYFSSDAMTSDTEIGFSISYQLCTNTLCV